MIKKPVEIPAEVLKKLCYDDLYICYALMMNRIVVHDRSADEDMEYRRILVRQSNIILTEIISRR